MAKIKCPRCKGYNVDHLGGKESTTLNLNPLRPFTLFNKKPRGKQEWHCRDCGHVFKAKI